MSHGDPTSEPRLDGGEQVAEEEELAEALTVGPNAPGTLPLLGTDLVGREEVLVGELPGGQPSSGPLTNRQSMAQGLRDAGPLALAGVVANGANVIVTVLMARLLTTRDYGALAQLTSLFLILSLPGTALIVGVVRRIAESKGDRSPATVRRWARHVHWQTAIGLVAFGVVIFAARGAISDALSLPDPSGVFAILLAGAVWILLSLDRGLLEAHRGYRALSVNLLVEGGARTAGVLCLVGLGFGVVGAAWGILVGETVAMLHARVVADRAWSHATDGTPADGVAADGEAPASRHSFDGRSVNGRSVNGRSVNGRFADGGAPIPTTPFRHRFHWRLRQPVGQLSPEWAASERRRALVLDVAVALVAMALLAVLQNIDVIVLARDAPHASGSYAAISVASKALVFAALALGGYLLPEAALRWREGGHALRQLFVTLALLALPVGGLLLAAVAFPHLLLKLVFSSRYLASASALLPLVLAMACLSATVVLTMYLLAAGKRWVAAILFVGAGAATLAVAAAHGRPHSTALADLAVQAALVLVTGLVFLHVHRQRIHRGPWARWARPTAR